MMVDDDTYGGYVARHDRPPAFEGRDGHAYSVDVLVDHATEGAGPFGAAFVFVRWSDGAEQPAGHVETGYLAFGATPVEAERGLFEMSLYDVKAELDRAIAARQALGDW
jgi:hypothetical protein